MASNKHHEFTILAMNQLADSLPDFTIRQANKFVNVQGEFPLIIKFDYVGKWRLNGVTRLYVVAGVEIAADYTYFNTARTWVNAKRKFYISNFMCNRICLLPQATEWYVLNKEADDKVGVELLRYELTHYFVPYLNQLTRVEGMTGLLERSNPTQTELLNPMLGRNHVYDWITVIYLLLKAGQTTEAERCVDKLIAIINAANLPDYFSLQNTVATLNKLQSDFGTCKSFIHSHHTNTISAQ